MRTYNNATLQRLQHVATLHIQLYTLYKNVQLTNTHFATLQFYICNFTTLQFYVCNFTKRTTVQKRAQLTNATLQNNLQKCATYKKCATVQKARNFANATLQMQLYTRYNVLQNAQLYKCNFTTLQFYICNFTHFTKRATFYKRAILQMQLCKCNFTHVTTFYKTRIFTNTTLQLCKKRALYKRATLRLMCKHFARTILQLYIRYKNVQRFTTMFLQCVRITTRLCQVLMCLQH